MKTSRANRGILFAMTLLYFVSIYISDTFPGGNLLTLVPVAVMGCFILRQFRDEIPFRAGGFFMYMAAFTLFCFLSRFWAQDSSLIVSKIVSLVFSFVAMVAIVMTVYPLEDVNVFLKVIMYGGYCVCIYVFLRYGWSGVVKLLSSSSRVSNEMINANTMGLCAAYSMVINVYYILYDKRLRIMDVLMVPAVIILAVSGSRKAILVFLVGAFGVFVLKNLDRRDIARSIGKVLMIAVAAVGLIFILAQLPVFSNITSRMKNLISLLQGNETRATSDAWIRLAYNELGIRLFKEHPILGIGMGNANIYTKALYGHDHYLHNNYVELLACGGIVGFTLYYSVWVWLLVVFFRNRNQRDRDYDICLILFMIHMAMDIGMVSYYGSETYIFLILFWLEAQKLREKRRGRSLVMLSGTLLSPDVLGRY